MCNELLKNAFCFHFYDICRSLYTLSCNLPRRKRRIAYKMVPKGTDRAGIIRCAVILAHSNFSFAYNSVSKGTKAATSC